MAEVNLFKGGRPDPMFPACDGARRFTNPWPSRISNFFSRGHYVLSHPLHVAWQVDQQAALRGLTGPQTLNMLIIPAWHTVQEAQIIVDPDYSGGGPLAGCGLTACDKKTMAGTVFDVILNIYSQDTAMEAIEAGTATPLDTISLFAAVPGDAKDVKHEFVQEWIGPDQVGVVALKFTAGPAAGITYDQMTGYIVPGVTVTHNDPQVEA